MAFLDEECKQVNCCSFIYLYFVFLSLQNTLGKIADNLEKFKK